MSARRSSTLIPSTQIRSTATSRCTALVEDIRAGKVDLLLILGGNPAYDAPAELEFASALKSNAVGLKVFLGLASQRDGRTLPVACSRSALSRSRGAMPAPMTERSALFSRSSSRSTAARARTKSSRLSPANRAAGHDLVQQYWQKQHTGADFDAFWRKSLHDGWVDRHDFRAQDRGAEEPPGFPSIARIRIGRRGHRAQLPPRSLDLRRTLLE